MNNSDRPLLYNVMQLTEKKAMELYQKSLESDDDLERMRLLGQLEGIEVILSFIEDEMNIQAWEMENG